jgi:hypothetical protein
MSRRGGPDDEAPALADVEIGAAVQAKRLRFNRVPETSVSFDSADDNDSHTERENLPEEVEAGVDYRDVRVRWRGGARIVVKSDDAPPTDGT